MSISRYSLLDAADLLLKGRPFLLNGNKGDLFAEITPQRASIAAGITFDNVLVITGSRSINDYLFYNLRPFRSLPEMVEINEITSTLFPVEAYHTGFLLHAARVKEFLGGRKPDLIIGHSLGAASTQILGTHFAIPAIAFASPQVVKRRFLKPDAVHLASHPQWNVFNMAWRRDVLTRVYRLAGMRSLGHRVVVDTNRMTFGIAHFLKDYRNLIVKALDNNVEGLPDLWPDPQFPIPSRLA